MENGKGAEGIELPTGGSFNDYLQGIFAQDKKQQEEGAYLLEPKVDRLDLPIRLWRFDKGSKRYYYEPDEEIFFPSQTTVQMCELKSGEFLTNWKIRMALLMDNEDAPNDYRDERSQYGNLMHILCTEVLYFGGIDLDNLWGIIQLYRDINELWHLNVRTWLDELKKDISAFMQFIYDHEVEPIAVEVPITYPIKDKAGKPLLWLAGTVDLVARITYRKKDYWGKKYKSGKKKGQPKKTYRKVTEIAVIDYKSGKKGFYKGHEIQVCTYRQGWNDLCNRFGIDAKAESCFNFAPKNSRGDKATYTFRDQTEKEGEKYMPHLVELFMLDGHHEVPQVREVTGYLEVGKSAEENVSLIDPKDYMNKQYEKEQDNGRI